MRIELAALRGSARRWRSPVAAALAGWMLVCLFLVVGAGPLGWVVLAAAVVAVAGPGLYARRAGGNVAEACAYTFAAVMLSLPLPAVITLLVASWAGWGHWQ